MGDDQEKGPGAGAESAETPAPEARRRRIIPAKSDAAPPSAPAEAAAPPAAVPAPAPAAAPAPTAAAPAAAAPPPAAPSKAAPGPPKSAESSADEASASADPPASSKGPMSTPLASGKGRRFDVRNDAGRERRVARTGATSARETFRAAPAEDYPESYDGMPRRPARTGGPGSAFNPAAGRPNRSGPRPARPDGPRGGGDRSRPRTDRGRPGDARGPREGQGRPSDRQDPSKARAASDARPPQPRPSQPVAPPKPAAPPKPRLDVTLLGVPQAKVQDKKGSQKPALTPKQALAARAKARGGGGPVVRGVTAKNETTRSTDFSQAWLEASAADAVAVLREAGEAAEALIDAWQKAQNVDAIAEAAEADGLPGGARKAARRAANVLKARGVHLPERARKARFDERGESVLEATLSPSDGMGTSVYTVVERDPGGRCHIAEVVIREPFGILRAGAGWLSRSQLKEGRERAGDAAGSQPVSIPVEWARYRIAQAKKMNETSQQLVPLGLEGCRPLIDPVPDEEPRHPLQDLVDAVASESAPDVAGSEMLHQEPEFRAWLPDRRAIDDMLRQLATGLGADGVGNPEKVDQALTEEMKLATDRFFSPEVRAIIVRRMRDAAISIRQRSGDDGALRVLRIARAIEDAGLITQPPQDIPFLLTFFQKAVALLAQQGGGALRIPMAGTPPGQAASESVEGG